MIQHDQLELDFGFKFLEVSGDLIIALDEAEWSLSEIIDRIEDDDPARAAFFGAYLVRESITVLLESINGSAVDPYRPRDIENVLEEAYRGMLAIRSILKRVS